MHHKVSVIIVHWNTPESLRALLELLTLSDSDLEIIVVDNDSRPHPTWIKKYKKIYLIQNASNRGYAAACNQGAKKASREWLLFLNPDTHLTAKNIQSFVDIAVEKKFDAASPMPSSTNYYKPLPSPLSLLVEFTPLHHVIPLTVFKLKCLFGGGLLIKNDVFKKVGGWDERFFIFFEDADLTKKILDSECQIGWIKIPHTHAGGTSFKRLTEKKQSELYFDSMQKYADKYFSILGRFIISLIRRRFT